MVEKGMLFLSEHFRVFEMLCSVFMAFVVSFMIDRFFVVRRQWYWKALLFCGSWLLSSIPLFIGDLVNLPPTILVFVAGILVSCEGNLLKKLSISFMIISLASSFSVLTDNYLMVTMITDDELWPDRGRVFYLFVKLFFYLLIYFSVKKFVPKKSYELSNGLWSLLGLLTMTPFCTVLSVVLFQQYSNDILRANAAFNKTVLCLCLLSFVGLIWAVVVLSHQYELEQRSRLLEMNQLYYESLERQQLEVRKLRHDMANHLQTRAGLSGEEHRTYLDRLLEQPGIRRNVQYCANPVINAVLSTKSGKMAQEQIDFEYRLQVPTRMDMDSVDLSVLFANSIDNAIEACEKLPVQRRKIALQAKNEKGLFVLKIENTTDQEEKMPEKNASGFLPQTTKKDQKLHGYGLKSIQEIVQRYEGSMEITKEDGRFVLFLYIPVIA